MITADEITVIVPSLIERRSWREHALASVAAQTIGIPRVHVIMGMTPWDARNTALAVTTTPWTAFLDDDDWLEPQHLERLALAADRTSADLIWPKRRMFDDAAGTFSDPYPEGSFALADEAVNATVNHVAISYLIRTDLARIAHFPPRRADRPSDWSFLLRLKALGARFVHVPESTFVVRKHESNAWSWKDDDR